MITPGSHKHAEIVGDIANAGRQLLQMIDDVLETATIASGDVEMDLGPVALDAVINEALGAVVAGAAARRLDTRGVSAPPGINLLVDSAVAKRIFTNLLRNAVTFTPEGGAIGVSADASDPNVVDVVVWDTGPGIPEDLREHVFSPFARAAHDVYVRAADGAGLGLSQARGWAALMGGMGRDPPARQWRQRICSPLAQGAWHKARPHDRRQIAAGGLGACAVEVLILGDWRATAGEVGSWPEYGHLAGPTLGWKSHTGRPERKRFVFPTRSMGAERRGASALADQNVPQHVASVPIRLMFNAKHTRSHSPRTFAKPRRLYRGIPLP